MTVNGKKALNMVSSNFLGVAGDPKIQVCPVSLFQQHLCSVCCQLMGLGRTSRAGDFILSLIGILTSRNGVPSSLVHFAK